MNKFVLIATGTVAAALTMPASAQAMPVAPCSSDQVQVTEAGSQAASSHLGLLLQFSLEPGAGQCSLTGYPGVDASGPDAPLLHAQRSMFGFMGGLKGATPPTVVVSPGQPAYALVEGRAVDAEGNDCPKYTDLHVTAPDTTETVTVGDGVGCYVFIHPVGSPPPIPPIP
jgi:hypothetical protein